MQRFRSVLPGLLLVPVLLAAGCGDDAPTQPTGIPTDGLVLLLPFENNTTDRSGHGNDGVLHGSATAAGFLVTGLNGSDHLTVPGSLLDGAGDLTVSAWVRLDVVDANSHQLVSGASATEHNKFGIWYRAGVDEWVVGIRDISHTFESDARVEDMAWHHLAVVRQGTTARLYLDGALVDSRDVLDLVLDIEDAGLVLGQDQDVVGGGFEVDEGWGGAMDNVRLYRRALTTAEIALVAAEAH